MSEQPETNDDDVENEQKEPNQPAAGTFDAATVLSQLEVTEYSYSTRNYHDAFMVIKNNSACNIERSVNAKFMNEQGALIGAKSTSQEAFEKGTETLLDFMPDEDFVKMDYEISVAEETWYACVVSDLSFEMTSAKKKEIVTITNNGTEPAEFIAGSMLFFDGERVVEYSSAYFVDDDFELKHGKAITEELDCYEQYDSVRFFMTGRRQPILSSIAEI